MESKAQKLECNTAGTMGGGVLGVTAAVHSLRNPGGNGEAEGKHGGEASGTSGLCKQPREGSPGRFWTGEESAWHGI